MSAAIHRQVHAGAVPARVGGEEEHGVGDGSERCLARQRAVFRSQRTGYGSTTAFPSMRRSSMSRSACGTSSRA